MCIYQHARLAKKICIPSEASKENQSNGGNLYNET